MHLFFFHCFPVCIIFFAASLLGINNVLVLQVAFLVLFVNLLNNNTKKMLIFLDAWGNSLIPDKLPRKSQKWLSLPQRQGCKNWKGFHFLLFQLLQKETFAGVWSQKTVTEQIKITKIPICEPSHIQLSCPALSQGINQPGCAWCAQQCWLVPSSCRAFTENIHRYWCWKTQYSLVWKLPARVLQKRGTDMEWIERHGKSRDAGELSVLHSCLHSSGGFSWGLRTRKRPGALIPQLFVQSEGLGRDLQQPDHGYPGPDVLPETSGCPWDIWDPVLQQGTSLSYISE